MTRYTFIIFLILFSTGLLNAEQAGTVEKSATLSEPPVSQEDLKKATDAIKDVKREASNAAREAKKAADALEQARQLHEKERAEAIVQEVKAKVESERKEKTERERQVDAQKASELAQKKTYYTIVTGLVVLAVIIIAGFVLIKKRGAEQVVLIERQELSKSSNEPLTNPDIPTLREYCKSHNLTKAMFWRQLDNKGTDLDGQKIECIGEILEKGDPLVWVGNDPTPAAWDKHVAKAARLIAARESGNSSRLSAS